MGPNTTPFKTRLKVYLAGPDVFLPNAMQHGVALRALCEEYGFEGVYPLDAPGPTTADLASGPQSFGPDDAARIYRANIALIRGADAVMANLQNFRGYEPDSGTAFEVGFAAALGLPVWAYGAPSEPIIAQVPGDASGVDRDGYLIESFGLSRNLMLACSATIVDGDVRACLAAMQATLLAGEPHAHPAG